MNSFPLVSITIPTFNVAEFVAHSLECLINQSYRNTEIICIDDGSTDGTLAILNEYAARDTRIRVIAKEKNEGLAVARNLSLKEAKGEYILFVDGDDLIDAQLIEKAVALIIKEQSDLVIWDYQAFYTNSELEGLNATSSQLSVISADDTVALIKRPAFTWVKMYRTQAIRDLKISFPKGLTRQDIPVHWHVLTSKLKRSILSEKLSYYRQQPDATTAQKGRKLLDIAQIQLEVKKVLDSTAKYDIYKDTYLEQQLNMLHGMYDTIQDELKPEALDLIHNQIGPEQIAYIISNKPMRFQARWFYKKMKGDTVALLLYTLWEISRATFRLIKRNGKS
jgi:glycosyltransferase involved in cell wall biosynthesis